MRFVCLVKDDKYEEIMTYNQIMDHIEQSEEDAILWRLKQIAGHEGPLTCSMRNSRVRRANQD
jgi:hypothetical protein